MDASTLLAEAAAHISDASRVAMLWSLMGGRARPASELAMIANVSRQTASNHLARLAKAGIVTIDPVGRNRFYRLNGTEVAAALESLAALGFREHSRSGLVHRTAPELVFARRCYDHLAGELGVAIYDRLRQSRYLKTGGRDLAVTEAGEAVLSALGVNITAARSCRRRFAHECLDWSERVFHLGGALGAALLDWLLAEKALAASKGTRLLRLTERGVVLLEKEIGIRLNHKKKLVPTRRS